MFGRQSFAIEKSPVAAAQIADRREGFPGANHAMMAADPIALWPQLALFAPANHELRPGNRDGLPGVFPADGDEFDFHGRTDSPPELAHFVPSSISTLIIPAADAKIQ